ncbi:MAG: response regulator transcription factor [Bacteroidota bacterium]
MINIAIVEDTTEIREALQMIVSTAEDMTCTYTYASAEDALDALPALAADVVLMDIHLPGISGIECVEQWLTLCPTTLFLMCTIYEDDEHIFDALKAGATGYIVKKTPADKLLAAIRELHTGGSPMSASIARRVIGSFKNPPVQTMNNEANLLSTREKEILTLLSQGFFYKEISARLYVSLDTVKKHCNNIYRKLQVNSRTGAVNKVFGRT